MHGLISAIDVFSLFLARVTKIVCVAILFVMLALLATQVVARYVFGSPPSWTEEVTIILFAWLVLLFASVGVREQFHVAVDWLADSGPTVLRRLSDGVVVALTFLLGLVLVVSGYHYSVETLGQMTAALQMPIEALHLAAPVSGILIMIHAAARFLRPGEGPADE